MALRRPLGSARRVTVEVLRMRGFVVALGLLVGTVASPATAATPRTCHWWETLTILGSNAYARSFKLGYVAGFAQGAYIYIAQARSEERRLERLVAGVVPREVRRDLGRLTAEAEQDRLALDLAGFTIEQLVNGLDQLCADGANEEVDVHRGLAIVRWRLDGRPEPEIARELERLRALGRGAR